jgi:chorismate synthase
VLRSKEGTASKVKKSSLSTINSKAVAKTRHHRQQSSYAVYTDAEANTKSHSSFLKGRKSVNNLDNSTTNESKTSNQKINRKSSRSGLNNKSQSKQMKIISKHKRNFTSIGGNVNITSTKDLPEGYN